MRFVSVSLMIVLNIILESTIFQYTRVFGIKPDFTIVLIVSYAIIQGGAYSTFIGLASGILLDLMYGKVFGINALAYMVTGFVIGQSHKNVFKDSYVPAVLFNIFAVFVYQNIYFLASYFSNNFGDVSQISYIAALLRMFIPQCLYNAVLGGFIYRYLYRLDERSWMDRKLY